MTIDIEDRVRRAFGDIVDAAGNLGPCPSVDDKHGMVPRPGVPDRRRMSPAAPEGSTRSRRWVAYAAGLLLLVGVGSVTLVANRRDAATTSSALVDLGSVDSFAVGSITTLDDPPLFIVNDPSTGITVFDARSTHLGCILVPNDGEVDADRNVVFIDPCHGSLFDRSGNKLAGPAPRGMDKYEVTIADQRVFTDLSRPILGDPATLPVYSGEDLDTSLPVVGRGWADSMEFSLEPDVKARLYNALQTSIAACMHASGFQGYKAIVYPYNASFQDLVQPLDRRFATVMGYHEPCRAD